MARTNPRTLAALAITATHAIDALAKTIAVEPVVRTAIELVARAARGQQGLKKELVASANKIASLAEKKRDWKTPARQNYSWSVGAVATLASMAASGADHADLVLTHLGYGLPGERGPREARLKAWHDAALAETADLSTKETPKRVNAVAAAAEAKELARIAKALGPAGARLASNKGVRHKAKHAGTRARLAALLKRKKYPVHASVLAFDKAFGGIIIPEDGAADDWYETDFGILIGAYACLFRDGHSSPRGGRADLVPIAYTPNDCIVYLDKAGTAHFEDTIEDSVAHRWAPTGLAAMKKLLAWG